MENNQDELRQAVKRRCTSQKVVASAIGVSNIYFNYWIKNKRDVSEKTLQKIADWLND